MNENYLKIALIPAYKPDEKLAETARELKKAGLKVIVVDDGSGREYRKYFAMASEYAGVITYSDNHGKGYALRAGIRYIQKKFRDNFAVVTVDADGQHRADDAARVLATAVANPGRLVLGSRKFEGKVPARSRFGNSVTRVVFRRMTGIRVSDTQTGLRAFTSEIAGYLSAVKGDRYEYEMNVLMQCTRDRIDIIEIPVRTVYTDEDNSSSHFNPVHDSVKIYREILSFKRESGK